MPGDGSVRFQEASNQPGNTGSASGTISARTSAHAGSSSAGEPDSCSTPRSSATYTVDGLAATAVTGISRLRLGPSGFTPPRVTEGTPGCESGPLPPMSSPARPDSDT